MNPNEPLKTIVKKSLFVLASAILGYKDVNWQTHGETIEVLESENDRKLIVLPRGCLKSSIVTIAYPIWRLINNPNDRLLIDSELFTNSATYLRDIKSHFEGNQDLIDLFGPFKSKVWNQDEIILSTRTQNFKEASITAGGIGTTRVGMHHNCLHPETLVLTSDGFKPIKDLREKLRVYTSNGHFESVTKVIQQQSDKTMIGLKSAYQAKTNWVTCDHKILTFRDHNLQWIEAQNLTPNDFMAIPINHGKTRQISKVNDEINRLIGISDIWRLIGYWLAEGCKTDSVRGSNGIRLVFGAHETDYHNDVKTIVETHLKVPCHIQKTTKSNSKLIFFSHKDMREILEKFGSDQVSRHLPPFALNEDFIHLRELILGYWRGDGCSSANKGARTVSFTSISHDLLSGLQLVLTRFGIVSGVTRSSKGGVRFVANNSKMSVCKDAFTLYSVSPLLNQLVELEAFIPIKPVRSFITDRFWFVPLSHIERMEYSGPVYDIEVANQHDFYMPGMIAHNCIVGDDYNSPKNTASKENAQKVIDHYKYNLSILDPGGTYIVVGTRYAENDLIGHILREELGLKSTPLTGTYDLSNIEKVLTIENESIT